MVGVLKILGIVFLFAFVLGVVGFLWLRTSCIGSRKPSANSSERSRREWLRSRGMTAPPR